MLFIASLDTDRFFRFLPAALFTFQFIAQAFRMRDDSVVFGPRRALCFIDNDRFFWDRYDRVTSRRDGVAICRTQSEEADLQEAHR